MVCNEQQQQQLQECLLSLAESTWLHHNTFDQFEFIGVVNSNIANKVIMFA